MQSLANVTNLVIDMDGVLFLVDTPMPCLQEFIGFLRRRPVRFMLATNNATSTPQQYAAKLARMGVTIGPEEILTSATATSHYLAREYPRGTRVHVFGEAPVREAMTEAGFVLADEDVAVVVASADRELNFAKISRAAKLVRGGARFIATNLDPTRPAPEGLLPGTGALISPIVVAAEQKPVAIGKPEPTMYELAMAEMGADPATTAALGDRLDTDILGGQRAGLTSILVLSGSTTPAELAAWQPAPDYVFADIGALLEAWEQALA